MNHTTYIIIIWALGKNLGMVCYYSASTPYRVGSLPGSLTAQQKKIQQIIIYGQPPEGVECLKKEL